MRAIEAGTRRAPQRHDARATAHSAGIVAIDVARGAARGVGRLRRASSLCRIRVSRNARRRRFRRFYPPVTRASTEV